MSSPREPSADRRVLRLEQPEPDLLGRPEQGDGTCRGGYGVAVMARYGTSCAYCDRDMASSYETWLDLSVDHVVPRNAIAGGVPAEWIEDLLNHVTCCRACNEFLNGLRLTVAVPANLSAFVELRDAILMEKRRRAVERHVVERRRFEAWRSSSASAGAADQADLVSPSRPHWEEMNAQPRRAATGLVRQQVPDSCGVYCWYRHGRPQYSGRAVGNDGLKGRIWDEHLKTGPDLSRSSFRRNVCEHLGIAPVAVTKARPTAMTADQVAPVGAWIRECEVAWLEFQTEEEALEFERQLHSEWLPPLSRR